MRMRSIRSIRTVVAALAVAMAGAGIAATTAADSAAAATRGVKVRRMWMPGFEAPATPRRYDKVGIVKVGSSLAKNVLVLEPGTSAGAPYFVPFAKWLVEKAPGWQVWAVERRENLLEDQSEERSSSAAS